MLILTVVAGTSSAAETLSFTSATPIRDAVRRLEGKLGVPISIDLGPTAHFLRLPDRTSPGPYSVRVPDDPSGLRASLQAVADEIRTHPSWDGCLKLAVTESPWVLQATQVAETDTRGHVVRCVPYDSPLGQTVAGEAADGRTRTWREICSDSGILVESSVDPIPPEAKLEKTTLRHMLDVAAAAGWSFRFSETPVEPTTWILQMGRPGDRLQDLDPSDYPYHRAHAANAERRRRDAADPGRRERLDGLRVQRDAKRDLLRQVSEEVLKNGTSEPPGAEEPPPNEGEPLE